MVVTEEEAKTKRCQESFGDGNTSPQGYTHVGGGIGIGMYPMGGAFPVQTSPSMCIGSACMAFRWVALIENGTVHEILDRKGYCGKAGKP